MTIEINNLETFLNADDQEYTRDIPEIFEANPTIKCEECNEEAYYYSATKYICVDCGIEIIV
jgi:hypothetical protein